MRTGTCLILLGEEVGGKIIRGVSKKFGEWYQKTNKTEDTNN
jgi:hypothetical protein